MAWVRQCDLDAGNDDAPPIPSRIASDEEFVPIHEVDAAEARDNKAFDEKRPKDQFVFDMQTHDVDVKAVRNAIRTDKLSDLRRQYRENPDPSNTQYGWIWTDDAKPPTVPVGTG